MVSRKTESTSSSLPTARQVEDYLRAHPEFLHERPDLLAELLPARDLGEAVADLQAHALRHLRTEVEELRSGAQELIHNARTNMSTQTRTHEAVLALLAADGFDTFMRTVTDDLPVILQVDLAVLCFEPGLPPSTAVHVQELRPGAIDRLLGPGEICRLRAEVPEDPALYGSGRGLVASDALVRLPLGDDLPPGLIALGSRQQGMFHSGQATELLTFLAAVVAHGVRQWVAR